MLGVYESVPNLPLFRCKDYQGNIIVEIETRMEPYLPHTMRSSSMPAFAMLH